MAKRRVQKTAVVPPGAKAAPGETKAAPREPKAADSDYASARNLFDLVGHLDRGGKLSVNSIQKKCGVGQGTAKKYLTFLKERRDLTATMQGTEKFWSLAAGGPKTRSFDEAAALELSLRSATWLEGTPYYKILAQQVALYREGVPADQQDRLQSFVRAFWHRTQGDATYSLKQGQLTQIMRAIRDRRPCEIEYEKHVDHELSYRLHPLALVLYKDRLYVSACKSADHERRWFVLEAVSSVRVDEEAPPFSIPDPRFTEAEQLFRHSFGLFTEVGDPVPVEIEVRGSAATTLKRRKMHPTQQFERGKDGWFVVRWNVALCPELESFLLALSPNVRVRAPSRLRERLEHAARAFLEPDPG